jgi:hypothetical protein
MLENYSICSVCDFLLKKDTFGLWRDIDGYHSRLDPQKHLHTATNPEKYDSHKYGKDIRVEILDIMSGLGFTDEDLGEADTFGFFALFLSEFAILEEDSCGFVFATFYASLAEVEKAWSDIEADYDKWNQDDSDNYVDVRDIVAPLDESDPDFLYF